MNAAKLFEFTMNDLKIQNVHPLHRAMIEECCENAVNNEQGITDPMALANAVSIAFISCNAMFKATMTAALKHADNVNFTYRGLSIPITADSVLLKN